MMQKIEMRNEFPTVEGEKYLCEKTAEIIEKEKGRKEKLGLLLRCIAEPYIYYVDIGGKTFPIHHNHDGYFLLCENKAKELFHMNLMGLSELNGMPFEIWGHDLNVPWITTPK